MVLPCVLSFTVLVVVGVILNCIKSGTLLIGVGVTLVGVSLVGVVSVGVSGLGGVVSLFPGCIVTVLGAYKHTHINH